MRIAIFTNTYPPTINGVAQCVRYYERGLQQRGHEVVIFAPAPEDYDRRQDPEHVYRFPSLPLPMDIDYSIAMPYSKQVVKALRRLDFDVIHTQHPFWVGAWGAWYARWTDTPLVTTVHTHYRLFAHLLPFPEPLVESYMKVRVTSYCNKCEVVATPVESMRQMLRQEGVRTPLEIIPNPTDLAQFAHGQGAAARQRHGIPAQATVLGFVGRLSPEKSLRLLVEATARVLQRHPETYLLLVGEGSEREELQQQVRGMGLAERIIFAGVVPHGDIPDYQAAFDLFVTASRGETQPLAYTEAMAVGRPVVAVDAPGARDMVQPGRTGLLAAARPEALAESIEELVADPVRRAQMGECAREWVQRFDVGVVAQRLEEVYDQAMSLSEEEPI